MMKQQELIIFHANLQDQQAAKVQWDGCVSGDLHSAQRRAGYETEVETCLVNQACRWSAEQVWRADT